MWKNTVRHVNCTGRMPWIVIDGGSRYGVTGDHDRCEWFLLVPAHLGCPAQNPESRKIVVCVCVCVCERW